MRLYRRSTHIPIGEDNFQHVQLAQHTAHRFNRIYGDTFTMPKAIMESELKNAIIFSKYLLSFVFLCIQPECGVG